MPHHPSLAGEVVFQVLAEDARFYMDGPALGVKPEHAVHPFHVEHHRPFPTRSGAADPRARAIGHDHPPRGSGQRDHERCLTRVVRPDDEIGGWRGLAPPCAEGVPRPEVTTGGLPVERVLAPTNASGGEGGGVHGPGVHHPLVRRATVPAMGRGRKVPTSVFFPKKKRPVGVSNRASLR